MAVIIFPVTRSDRISSIPPPFPSSHLISLHLVSSHLTSSHYVSSHYVSSHYVSSHYITGRVLELAHLSLLSFCEMNFTGYKSVTCQPGL